MQRTSQAPDDIRSLHRSEHLLLWAFRATAVGHADCPALHRGFGDAIGGTSGGALMHLLVLVRTLGHCGLNRLKLHIPGCLCVSPDEQAVLALFAAAQHSIREHDETQVRADLARLLPFALIDGALLAAQSVAAALEAGGQRLPLREPAPYDPSLHNGAPAALGARNAGLH